MATADVILLVSWALFAVISCHLTLHLYKDLGVIVASQAFVMTLGALAFTLMIRGGASYEGGIGVAMCLGAALGLLHVPLLRMLGPNLLLVLTAVTHIVLAQFWLALPQWTGGSGGLLLPRSASWWSPLLLLIALAIAIGYRVSLLRLPHATFSLASIRTAGEKAGALGVPVLLLYILGFGLYGVLLAVCGAQAAQVTGFLAPEMFGLSWALTVVLITLVSSTSDRPVCLLMLLAVVFAVTKIGLRQILQADPQWAHAYDVILPASLLLCYVVRGFWMPRTPLP